MATRSYLAQQVAVCLWRKKTGLKSQNGAFSQTLRSRMSMTDSPTPLKEGELYSKIVSTFDQKCRMCKSIRKSNASSIKIGNNPKMERVLDGQFVLARVSFDPFWWRRAWTTCSSLPTTSTMLALCVGSGDGGAVPICGELVLDTGSDAVYMCFPFWWLSPRLAAKCSTNNPPKRSSNPPMILIA